jgi:tetratricopeptide (TPR) repeat protein
MKFLKKIFGQPDDAKSVPMSTGSAEAPARPRSEPLSPETAGPALESLESSPAAPAVSTSASLDPSRNPDMIRVLDGQGREVLIPKAEWCEKILPGAIQKEWDNPNNLAQIILRSLDDGLASEVLDAAIQLEDIDADMERGNVLLGLVQLETGHLEEAEKAFRSADGVKNGSAVALANLAVVQERKGEKENAKATRWQALLRDPNQEQALGLFAQAAETEGGETALLEALRRVETLPGSWRAKAWMARHALRKGDKPKALAAYREILARPEPLEAEALMQMSGDLGNAGALEAIVDLFGPGFDPALHGVLLGNNLIKANVELGRTDTARAILQSLQAQQRPDWGENLAFWEAQLNPRGNPGGDRSGAPAGAAPAGAPIEIAVMPLAGPVWARRQEGFEALLPAKAAGAPHICVAAPTVSGMKSPGEAVIQQREDKAGVFSRALAVYLAERIHMETSAVGTALLLGLKDRAGFVMGNAPYPTGHLLQMARLAGPNARFVVNAHIVVGAPKWMIALTALDIATGEEAGRFAGETDPDDPGILMEELAVKLCAFAREKADASAVAPPAWYAKPASGRWPAGLSARMQALALATAALHKEKDPGLSGERPMVDGLMKFAADEGADAVARMLLITSLNRLKELGSAVPLEYAEGFGRLAAEAPLPEDVRAAVAAAARKVFAR